MSACGKCGKPLPGDARFCPYCGTPVPEEPAEPQKKPGKTEIEGKKISENIFLCPDGKYRWVYEMSLFRNPSVILLLAKIFFFVLLGIVVFSLLADACNGNLDGETLLGTLKVFGICGAVMAGLLIVGYLIYALINGGKYVVMFEMDEQGVNHKQMPKQAKKAEVIGFLTVLAGIASGRPSTVGAGIAAARTEMYSEFSKVRKVKPRRAMRVIKVNGLLNHNQVYASAEDFDFVLNYINQAVAKARAAQPEGEK